MKLHLSLAVKDFDAAMAFYSELFKLQPKVQRDGYAKWDVQDPPVNFSISVCSPAALLKFTQV